MSEEIRVTIEGKVYILSVEENSVVGVKRFNKNYGMWVRLNFSNMENEAQSNLLDLLKEEYINQVTELQNQQLNNNPDQANTKVV